MARTVTRARRSGNERTCRATIEPAHDQAALHARSRTKGANPIVYWLVRAVLQPFFHLYFRMSRVGREHIPAAAA